ncbi:MAG: DMT family transporter [Gammaproteobacteria bacterium]|nr:DMT family transporter [Gammaproteobacteria bacterium]
MTDPKHGMPILYAAVFLLALNGLFAKLIPLDATSITQLRSVLAAITLFLFALLGKRQYRLDSLRQYLGVYGIGVVLGLHWVSFFHAMQVSTVAIGMLSLFTYPMITVLLEPFFSKQKIRLPDIFAAIVVLIGIFMMVKDDMHAFDSDIVQGVFWGVSSAFLFALRNVMQKYYYPGISADRLMMHQVIAISFMLALFVEYPAVVQMGAGDWLTLLLLGVISTATAHTLLAYSLKHLPAKSIAMISCLQPFFATLFAWLLLNEEPGRSVLIGGVIIVSVALYESLKMAGARRRIVYRRDDN